MGVLVPTEGVGCFYSCWRGATRNGSQTLEVKQSRRGKGKAAEGLKEEGRSRESEGRSRESEMNRENGATFCP